MRALRLALPPVELAIEAPQEMVEALARIHPAAVARAVEEPFPSPAAARYRVEAIGGGWSVVRDHQDRGSFARPIEAALRLEHDFEWDVIRACDAWIAVHAGAVAVGPAEAPVACLVAGLPGSGKTSTVFQLLELGHGFLCEEVALLDPVERRVHPFQPSLSLDAAFLDEVRAGRRIERGVLDPTPAGVRYRPHRLAGPAPLAAVLLPRYLPAAASGSVAEPPREAALVELMGHCFPPAVDLELWVDRFGEALAGARLLELRYRDAAEARGLLAELFPGSRGDDPAPAGP